MVNLCRWQRFTMYPHRSFIAYIAHYVAHHSNTTLFLCHAIACQRNNRRTPQTGCESVVDALCEHWFSQPSLSRHRIYGVSPYQTAYLQGLRRLSVQCHWSYPCITTVKPLVSLGSWHFSSKHSELQCLHRKLWVSVICARDYARPMLSECSDIGINNRTHRLPVSPSEIHRQPLCLDTASMLVLYITLYT